MLMRYAQSLTCMWQTARGRVHGKEQSKSIGKPFLEEEEREEKRHNSLKVLGSHERLELCPRKVMSRSNMQHTLKERYSTPQFLHLIHFIFNIPLFDTSALGL